MISDWIDEHIGLTVLLAVLSAILAIIGVATAVEHLDTPAQVAGFEAMRHEASTVMCDARDVRAAAIATTVAEANASLARLKQRNRQWWSDPFVSDRWNGVTPITLCYRESPMSR